MFTDQIASLSAPKNSPRIAPPRLPWVDNLRTLLILLVVNIHACVTYSHVGDWYIKEPPEPALPTKLVFFIWEFHLQAFFMGLLFFISGFFAHFSIERRGAGKFLRDRLLRLGIPLLAYVFVIHPFICFVIHPWKGNPPPLGAGYVRYLTSGEFLESTGPLWFVETLLFFCSALALVRSLRSANGPVNPTETRWSTIGASKFLGLGLVLAIASFLMRTVQPIGDSVLNLQLCFFPQYIVAFSLGVIVAQRFDLVSIARFRFAKRWAYTALIFGPPALIGFVAVARPALERDLEPPFSGGWNWSALGLAAWEQFAGIALSLGIMAFALRRMNFETAWSRWLSDRSFGVYVIHTPVLIAVTVAMRGIHANPFVLAGLLTVLGLIGSYVAADLLRRIPGVRAAF